MERDRWLRVEELFHAALEHDEAERHAFLQQACGGDGEMRREIESLLSHERDSGAFLEPVLAGDLDLSTAPMASRPPDSGGWSPPERVAHYRIVGKLGEGGMGVVYVAVDEKLNRRVALKLLRRDSGDTHGAQRLIREARVAAGISHPLICQVFELGEWNHQPYIAMELVEGESLAARLTGAALAPAEALRIARAIVESLTILHGHGVVHRDLKPSNVFLTTSGVKVLDFGLARPLTATGVETVHPVTQQGVIVGTPQYAAPEQLTGAAVDARADLFSVGVVLFEMLTGRRPFTGATIPAIIHAVLYETPPVLTGSPAITAIDRVLHRALAKRAGDRYESAAVMLRELDAVLSLVHDDQIGEARPILRLAVLPFRLLKPDAEIAYLTLSVAEALTSTLSGFESLVVRSSLKSARYADRLPDLDVLAAELAIDVVLTGSIIRQGHRLRVSAELATVPAGDVLWKQTNQVALESVFDLHEQLARRVVESLPLSGRDQTRAPAKSTSTKAFDLYLRGMQLRMETSSWRQARSFFDQCLDLDPGFAPAWAERGRLDRVLGKYDDPALLERAESGLLKAMALDPDNGAAQYYYAQLEIDLGRLDIALTRLLDRARERRAEPQIYAALVHACRYAGLLDGSLRADERAKQLDPTISTSVLHTFYMRGDYERALQEGHLTSDPFEARVIGAMGRRDDAIAAARREEERFATVPRLRGFSTGFRAALEGREEEALEALRAFDLSTFTDGEGLYYLAEIFGQLQHVDDAIAVLERAVTAGFACLPVFGRSPYLAPLRSSAAWPRLMRQVEEKQRVAIDAFVAAGGRTILGAG